VDLGGADLIVGTSAGAITAALLATGQDPDRLATPVHPASGSTPPQVDGRRLGEAFAVLGNAASDPAGARRRVGQIALAAETGPEQAHVARMRAMVGADQWPDRQLLIPVLDAETGEQEVFDRASGASLACAVAACTAFPGIYPPITVNGRRYMDGSLRSATNAGLAAGARTLVVVDPQAHLFPRELLHQELAVAAAHTVVTIEPDPASIRAFGSDLNDRTAWEPAYQEGLRQAADAAEQLRLAWRTVSDTDLPWVNTTHDWSNVVDAGHLARIRQSQAEFTPGGPWHLVLEVVAYAADEASCQGGGRCVVILHPDGSLSVGDDGRGTDTRVDEHGRSVRKPVMASKDLRFFDFPEAEVLPDGHARRGMSVVAALSEWLVHTNRRLNGAWAQRYQRGIPVTDLEPVEVDGTTGTLVHFKLDESLGSVTLPTAGDLARLGMIWPALEIEVVDRRTG
jgi:NTE family protein